MSTLLPNYSYVV